MHFPLMAELCRVCGQCRAAGGKDRLQLVLPRHLRPRREKIFGPAPSHRLDGNAKARVWAAAAAYNIANRVPRQHQGPLTWAASPTVLADVLGPHLRADPQKLREARPLKAPAR
jgi:hypothetical protein